jgi:hypothetical protein
MTTQTILTFATALVIGFAFGRIYIYNQLKKTLNLEKQSAKSDTPIGDALAEELHILLHKIATSENP